VVSLRLWRSYEPSLDAPMRRFSPGPADEMAFLALEEVAHFSEGPITD
jgi:hypothetical protein